MIGTAFNLGEYLNGISKEKRLEKSEGIKSLLANIDPNEDISKSSFWKRKEDEGKDSKAIKEVSNELSKINKNNSTSSKPKTKTVMDSLNKGGGSTTKTSTKTTKPPTVTTKKDSNAGVKNTVATAAQSSGNPWLMAGGTLLGALQAGQQAEAEAFAARQNNMLVQNNNMMNMYRSLKI